MHNDGGLMFGHPEVQFNEHYGSRMEDWFNFNFLLDTFWG